MAAGDAVAGVVGADAIGPSALLNADGTRELAARLPTLVVATAVKLVPGPVFERLGGPGFEVVPLELVAAVVVGPEVLSPGRGRPPGRGPPAGSAAVPLDPGQELVGGAVGAELAGGDLLGQGVEGLAAAELAELGAEVGQGDLLDLAGGPAAAAASSSPEDARWSRWAATASTSSPTPSPRSATVRTTGTCQGRASPRWSIWRRSRATTSAPSRSALLTTNTSATSRMPALATCTASPNPGRGRPGWCRPGRLDLGLADPDGLDQDDVAAGGVQHPHRLRGRPGQAAQVALGGHRADVDALVEGVALHPHPVAEQAPPVNGEDGSTASTPTVSPWAR